MSDEKPLKRLTKLSNLIAGNGNGSQAGESLSTIYTADDIIHIPINRL